MDRDQTNQAQSDEQEVGFAEANMDRTAQSGSEGAFGQDNPDSSLEELREDAEAAFGQAEDSGSSSQ